MVAARQQSNNPDNVFHDRNKPGQTRKLGDVALNLIKYPMNNMNEVLTGPCVFLYLPDSKEPIELRNIALVTLGRSDSYSDEQPMIDLNPHHAKLLGVSRIHAQIVYHNDNYYIRDLNSTNGTWVNQEKINPGSQKQLISGDTIRLGHLMIQVGGV